MVGTLATSRFMLMSAAQGSRGSKSVRVVSRQSRYGRSEDLHRVRLFRKGLEEVLHVFAQHRVMSDLVGVFVELSLGGKGAVGEEV